MLQIFKFAVKFYAFSWETLLNFSLFSSFSFFIQISLTETVSSDLMLNATSQAESIHEVEEDPVSEQKDENKLGFCEIQ